MIACWHAALVHLHLMGGLSYECRFSYMQHLLILGDATAAGQRVFGQVAGSLASHVLADSSLLVAMPPTVTFEQAATMPTVFMTADMAFHHAMSMVSGTCTLLHAAAGTHSALLALTFASYSLELLQFHMIFEVSADDKENSPSLSAPEHCCPSPAHMTWKQSSNAHGANLV